MQLHNGWKKQIDKIYRTVVKAVIIVGRREGEERDRGKAEACVIPMRVLRRRGMDGQRGEGDLWVMVCMVLLVWLLCLF